METVAVIIPVFGNWAIQDKLPQRARKSAMNQSVKDGCYTVHVIWRDTLRQARNDAAEMSKADWLIFLDADDELDEHYVEEMLKGEGDIRQPSTLGVHPDGHEDDYPVLIPPGPNFMVRNHLVIGCMVRRDLFLEVGGFNDLPILEDWELWIRLRLNGATLGTCPKAIYRVHVRSDSRNMQSALHGQTYTQIQQRYQTEWFAKGLA